MNDTPMVVAEGVTKTFEEGRLRAVDRATFTIGRGEFVAIMGPSGCGKSTLLNLIAALEPPDEGRLEVAGHDLAHRDDLDEFRACDVGLVFQMDNLLPTLSAVENVEMPMYGVVRSARARREQAQRLLDFVGMAPRSTTRPPELSGGERQRVAIARALANRPPLVLADEPTGRLDSRTSAMVMDLLATLRDEQGVTLVVVTHDPTVAARADRIIQMLDGAIVDSAEPERTGADTS